MTVRLGLLAAKRETDKSRRIRVRLKVRRSAALFRTLALIAAWHPQRYTEATVAPMTWKKAASVTEPDTGPIVFNHPPKQIALFKTGQDTVRL